MMQFKRKQRGELLIPDVPALPASTERFPLDVPLLWLSPKDPFTLRQACQGTQIFGGTGSGKTSTSAKALATAFLRSGFGGLVLCAKPGEAARWERYAKETGRSASVIRFDESGRWRFNFLDYELRRGERLVVHNVVMMLMRIMDAAKPGDQPGSNEAFWRDACADLLRNVLTALYCAYGTVTLANVMAMISSAPSSLAETKDKVWRDTSYCFKTLDRMRVAPVHPLPAEDLKPVGNFFFRDWAKASDKLRSSIEFTLRAAISPFLTGYLREMFGTNTNIIPEVTLEGALVIVDMPIKAHDQSGVLAQHVWKYLWQRCVERREVIDGITRPVFLFADECQFFVSEYDKEFQSTARESLACTVLICQNISTYYTKMDGKSAENSANSLLGNLQNKLFHQNTDAASNEWAADMISKDWLLVHNTNSNTSVSESEGDNFGVNSGGSATSSKDGTSQGTSWGASRGWNRGKSKTKGGGTSANWQFEYSVPPATFMSLRQAGGGRPAEAIVVLGGKPFAASGRSWLKVSFPQE